MHSQFADIPAGEEKWADHIGIGGEGQALACSVDGKGGRVIHGVKQRDWRKQGQRRPRSGCG